ncbi:hypothetical protein [Zhongshania sp.]|uniref:hypothetical protein n=1 Tax=Zhongshania sp. TaxID=1971902 RepID=UPI0035639B2E
MSYKKPVHLCAGFFLFYGPENLWVLAVFLDSLLINAGVLFGAEPGTHLRGTPWSQS